MNNNKTFRLSNGVEMPIMAMSTFGMDYGFMKKVVISGLEHGFRAFDTARDYANEHVVGRVLRDAVKEFGIKREDIFITTKIGNSQQIKGDIDCQIEQSLNNLCTDYVDLWIMHWPYPGYYIDTYHKMETVYETGKVHAIGMANYHIRHFDKLFESGIKYMPHCVQFECHPMRTATEILAYCKERNIVVQAYSPLCRMIGAIRKSPILQSLATKYKKTIGQVILRWHIQIGTMPVFRTWNPMRLKENSDVFDFELTNEEIKLICSMNEDYKFHLESASCPGF